MRERISHFALQGLKRGSSGADKPPVITPRLREVRMFQTVLFSVFASFFQMPAEVVPPVGIADLRIAAVLQASDAWFVAENRSEHVGVLFVGSAEIGLLPPVRLLPGVRLSFPFPCGTLGELLVELVILDVDGWRNSGAFAIATLRSVDDGTVWLTSDDLALAARTRSGSSVEALVPRAEILPRAVLDVGARTLVDYSGVAKAIRAPLHVPVIVPGGGEKRDRPPLLEKKPLPPV